MRDSVPSTRYSPVCNVLRLKRIWLIPTYRAYRLYVSSYFCTSKLHPKIYFLHQLEICRYMVLYSQLELNTNSYIIKSITYLCVHDTYMICKIHVFMDKYYNQHACLQISYVFVH